MADQQEQSRIVPATIETVHREYQDGEGHPQAEFTAEGSDGTDYRVDTGTSSLYGFAYDLDAGDRVNLAIVQNPDGTESVYFDDMIRSGSILWITVLFAAVIVAVGLFRGVRAIVGLAATVAILFLFAFPAILGGADPVFIAVVASVLILAINLQLTHGWTRATLVAFASTLVGLLFAWFFGSWFVSFAHLSGLASEESVLLFLDHLPATVLPSGILLAGIIIGATGALDDVAIAQGEIVSELREANPALGRKELFIRSMRVGRHHIASITNTLVLAYAGAALPMFLLFWATSSLSFSDFMNTEAVAEEVVRTLAGTLALVLTVPLSTWLAVRFDKR